MEIIKLLYFSLRKNGVLQLLIAVFTFFSLIFLITLLRFSRHHDQLLNDISERNEFFENVQVFHLTDGHGGFFYGAEVHEEPIFLQADGLERMKEFHYNLRLSNEFYVASAHTGMFLEIDASQFLGGEAFHFGYEWGLTGPLADGRGNYFYQIKAASLDYAAWNLSSMEMKHGRAFQAEDFSLFSGRIPIILGYQYANYYEIGDLITMYFLAFQFDFEVIGILAENQRLFNEVTGTYLDYSILKPLISFGNPLNEEERRFQSIYYNNKSLSAYIFVDDTPEAVNQMHNIIYTAAAHLNIPYSFSMTDHTFVLHGEMVNLIHHHTGVIHRLLINSILLIALIILFLSTIKYHRQKSVYQVHALLGISKSKQWLALLLENLIFNGLTVFIALYYSVFYSGIMYTSYQRAFFSTYDISRWPIFWEAVIFDSFSFYHLSLQPALSYSLFLLLVSIIYPTIKIHQLYKGVRSK
ncbi:MAG: hypothetical protein FWG67_08600 [Defluviitaleaceae bacterium]|nr:hypothetical protein [Defluviitaleaceae bacterium]